MRKLKNVKIFVMGLVAGMLLVGTTVFAAGAIASAAFNANRVIFDGDELDLDMPLVSIVTEANPDFFSNYMPVRAVLEAMGYEVDWDGANNAVLVTTRAIAPVTANELGATVWLSATGIRYHSVNDCGNMDPARARSMTRQQARDDGHQACAICW
ncbi:MAG: copper amine oxidase N-terminal domain-containing protein [Defluviitaleaceae bacterium]|nr:copper amine oxidase N-terminal domain-containing protein [Defluviitaleaceae bacterium]